MLVIQNDNATKLQLNHPDLLRLELERIKFEEKSKRIVIPQSTSRPLKKQKLTATIDENWIEKYTVSNLGKKEEFSLSVWKMVRNAQRCIRSIREVYKLTAEYIKDNLDGNHNKFNIIRIKGIEEVIYVVYISSLECKETWINKVLAYMEDECLKSDGIAIVGAHSYSVKNNYSISNKRSEAVYTKKKSIRGILCVNVALEAFESRYNPLQPLSLVLFMNAAYDVVGEQFKQRDRKKHLGRWNVTFQRVTVAEEDNKLTLTWVGRTTKSELESLIQAIHTKLRECSPMATSTVASSIENGTMDVTDEQDAMIQELTTDIVEEEDSFLRIDEIRPAVCVTSSSSDTVFENEITEAAPTETVIHPSEEPEVMVEFAPTEAVIQQMEESKSAVQECTSNIEEIVMPPLHNDENQQSVGMHEMASNSTSSSITVASSEVVPVVGVIPRQKDRITTDGNSAKKTKLSYSEKRHQLALNGPSLQRKTKFMNEVAKLCHYNPVVIDSFQNDSQGDEDILSG